MCVVMGILSPAFERYRSAVYLVVYESCLIVRDGYMQEIYSCTREMKFSVLTTVPVSLPRRAYSRDGSL